MIARILVPVDYSAHSLDVLSAAAVIAERIGAELELIHVWESMPQFPRELLVTAPDGQKRPIAELVQATAEREMNEFLSEASLPPRISVRHQVVGGDAARRILEALESGSFDLVVIGTHGRSGLQKWAIGNVAERVVRLSPVPVVAVPERRVSRKVSQPMPVFEESA
jgi:nucleotide-binding universal stress UspA family protein